MATIVINNRVYDTAKMKLVGRVSKWYEFKDWLSKQVYGEGMGKVYICTLYRSEKGRFLLEHESCGSHYYEAISEAEAKNLLARYDYKNYVKLYGELEEGARR